MEEVDGEGLSAFVASTQSPALYLSTMECECK